MKNQQQNGTSKTPADGRSGGKSGQNRQGLGDTRKSDETGAHKGGASGTGGKGGTGGSAL
jgi:hypothetical protein